MEVNQPRGQMIDVDALPLELLDLGHDEALVVSVGE